MSFQSTLFLLCISFSCILNWTTTCGFAQEAAQIKSGQVELQNSRVYVKVGKVGLGHEHGASGKLQSGTLHLNAPDQTGAFGKLVFDMTSFEADSDESRNYVGLKGSTDEATRKQVNENLLGKEVLDVSTHPTATFDVKKVTKLDEPSKRGLPKYKFEGDFTLHGTTKPISFIADVEVVKGWNHIRGGFQLLQSDYGIKPYSKMLGAVGVADKLAIFGDLIVAP